MLRELLTFKTRSLVNNKQVEEVAVEYSEGIRVDAAGVEYIRTWPGYWGYLKAELEAKGYEVKISNQTIPPPIPNCMAAMQGLRPLQRVLMMHFLMAGSSGMCAAPTRFGKTYLMLAAARAFPSSKIIVTAPGVSLVRQLMEEFMTHFPDRVMFADYTGAPKKRLKDRNAKLMHRIPEHAPWIWFCTPDALEKADVDSAEVALIDEPHAYSTEKRRGRLLLLKKALKLAFGATLTGRFDRADFRVESVVGPILATVTYKEAVDAGMIAPLHALIVPIRFKSSELYGRLDRAELYRQTFTESPRAAKLLKTIFERAIPSSWQTMAFIMDEKHAEYALANSIPAEGTIVMAKRMTDKARHAMTDEIAEGVYKRLLVSNIYVQGVTFPQLRVVLNLAGGGASTTAIQKPGRLLQLFPNKCYGPMIDFLFVCEEDEAEAEKTPGGEPKQGRTKSNGRYGQLIGESWARIRKYKEIGYQVTFIESISHLRKLILESWNDTPDELTLFPHLNNNGSNPITEKDAGGLPAGARENAPEVRDGQPDQ